MEGVEETGSKGRFLEKVRSSRMTKHRADLRRMYLPESGNRSGTAQTLRRRTRHGNFREGAGNGYALRAVDRKAKFLEAAQRTFISSTFWTERIGPFGGIGDARAMKRYPPEIITDVVTKV